MPARNWAIRFLFGLIIFLLAACVESVGHERENTPTPRAPYETPTATPETPATVVPVSAVPPEVEQFAAEWPSANKDYQNSRATKDSTINAGNVSQLGLAWTFDIHGASKWGSAAGGILVANKTVYFQDLKSNVFALDLQSGAIKWQKLFQQSAFGPNGPALGWGKLFVQDGVNHIVALDLGSGNQLWSSPLYGPTGANQPMAFGGFLYTGVADGVYFQNPGKALELNKAGTSGYTFGLDQANGALIWSFQTVEKGFWGHPEVNSGAGVWGPPSIDTESGMTYWSTGNPAPMPGIVGWPNASSRPGPNLYSESVLALDGKSGTMKWYRQVREHDIFNYDLQNATMLATAQIKGQQRKVVIATGKMGFVYTMDSANGDLYWQTPVGEHKNDELQELPLDETVITTTPGFWGGIESPAAVADGVVYVADVNLPSPYTATAFKSTDGDKAVTNIEGRIDYSIGNAQIIALDLNTGKLLWSTTLPTISFGGATVVNDLLFVAGYDGVLYALTRADGHIVWRYQAPGGIISWPAVAADTIVWPVGLGRKPQVIALRLGGKQEVTKPAAQALPAPSPTPTPVPPTPAPSPTPAQ